ncbi:LysM peptidoglycan-binding domain-containing protein [Bacillus sp. Marseille-P3661]|uniref:LysM peptidoglycan-binding domain-containing protein n=1 Tax=Bacillus sp. Marseille-P3661 TaxID=1936234 RepID=UPI000C85853B|nr:LysM peptidoglycan-binding domain-containing protein [Bacillus sp. Marseille-P3661]
MALHFTRKLTLLLIAGILVISGAFAGFYYSKIKPTQQSIESLKNSVATEEKLLAAYENKVNEIQEKTAQNSTNLQKKVPVKPILEQFLLDLERAEVVSNSFISSMTFGHEDVTVEPAGANGESTLENKVEGAGQIDEAQQIQNGDQQDEQSPSVVTTPPPSNLPPGMKRLSINLSVQSPNYYAMETFLKAIEDLERITKIDTLTFSGPPERRTIIEEEDTRLSYNLTISTFYHPGIEELQNELPPFEVPEPANKQNPLAKASNGINEVAAKEQVTLNRSVTVAGYPIDQVPEQVDELLHQQQDNVILHKVKPGESLYSISVKYYDTFKKELFLQEYNNLKNNIIHPNQIIRVPMDSSSIVNN